MSNTESTVREPMRLFYDETSAFEKKALNRDILYLALPVFIGQGINSLVGFISRIIMSKLGDTAFNSINIGMMVFILIITVVAAVGVGTTTLVAQNWGIGNKRRAGEIMQQSLIFGFFMSVAIMVFGLSTHRVLFLLLGIDPETAEMGAEFLFWLFVGIPFLTPGFFLASALRGAGDTKTPMYAGLIMAGLSLYLSYGLILGKLGMPRLEVVGAAIAIDISFLIFTCILAIFILANKTILKLPKKGWRPDMGTGQSIMKIGLPSAAEWILIQLGILMYVSVVTYYGKEALAGYFTGLAILSLAQAVTMGFQAASNTLVGQMVGAKNYSRAESVFRRTAFFGFVIMSIMGVVFFLGVSSSALSLLFQELNPRSLEYARTYILLLILALPLMGISFSIGGGLRGAGNTVLPLIASTIGVYGGRILFAMSVYHLFHPPIYIIWCSMFPDHIIRIVLMSFGLRSGKWKTVKVRL